MQLMLTDDMRMASLEALLPLDLEKHEQINGSRLTTHLLLRGEVVRCCEGGGLAHGRAGDME